MSRRHQDRCASHATPNSSRPTIAQIVADLIKPPFDRRPTGAQSRTIGASLANADPAATGGGRIALHAELELPARRPAGMCGKGFFVDIMTTALGPDEVLVASTSPPPTRATVQIPQIRHPASGPWSVLPSRCASTTRGFGRHDRRHGAPGRATRRIPQATPERQTAVEPKYRKRRLARQRTGECLSDGYASAIIAGISSKPRSSGR